MHPDPLVQFTQWYDEAAAAGTRRVDGVALATATPEGRPSVRIVLYKGIRHGGFTFFTNYESRKSRELDCNPWAALAFYWHPLYRQVRVEGQVERTSEEESDEYWYSRPAESRLSALASRQSEIIEDRTELEDAVADLRDRYEGEEIPRPKQWGGYRLLPHLVEFWQGQPNRLHDRYCYTLRDTRWEVEMLAP